MAVIVGETGGVGPSDRAFDLHSNRCDTFELGTEEGDDVWLHAEFAGEDQEPVFNGRLFSKDGGRGTVIDGFPKSDPPAGWTKHQNLKHAGYTLRDASGETVFGFSDVNGTCFVTVGLHAKNGGFAAVPGQGGLITDSISVRIGHVLYVN